MRFTISSLLVLLALTGCGAPARQVHLYEALNAQVGDEPIGLRSVESRKIWRSGQRVSVDVATILVYDRAENCIRMKKLFTGDDILVGHSKWSLESAGPGTSDTRAWVTLRESR